MKEPEGGPRIRIIDREHPDGWTPTAQEWDEWSEEQAALGTFEGQARQIEEIARRHAPPPRVDAAAPEHKSDAWFGRELLFMLQTVREMISEGKPEWAAVEALYLGQLVAEWPHTKKLVKRRRQKEAAGRKGGRARSSASQEFEKAVARVAKSIRSTTPYDRGEASTSWLARAIARRLNGKEHTVRNHLQRLGIK